MARTTPEKCTHREERFCEEFIIDLIGAAAARRCAVPAKNAKLTAFRMLQKPRVLKRIKELQEERSIRIHLTQDRVLEEQIILAFSDIADYVDIEDGGGIIAKKLEDMGPMKSRAIKKVKEDRAIKENKDDSVTLYDKISFELHDKPRALEFLAKHLGMEGGVDKLKLIPDIAKLMTQAHMDLQKEENKKE